MLKLRSTVDLFVTVEFELITWVLGDSGTSPLFSLDFENEVETVFPKLLNLSPVFPFANGLASAAC